MIPAFVKKLSQRITGSQPDSTDIPPLSKRDTLQLSDETGETSTMARTKKSKQSSLSKQPTFLLSKSSSEYSTSSNNSNLVTAESSASSGGSLTKRTSGGSVTKRTSVGSLTKRTSGGSLTKRTSGGSLTKGTSGGSVTKQKSGGSLTKQKSGGSVTKQKSDGPVTEWIPGGPGFVFGNWSKLPPTGFLTKQTSKSSLAKQSSHASLTKRTSSSASKKLSKGLSKTGPAGVNGIEPSRQPQRIGKFELWFYSGEFVSVRASDDDASYHICRLLQNVYNSSEVVKIRWVEERPSGNHNLFVMTSRETIDPATIVMSIRVDSRRGYVFTLNKDDIAETSKILNLIVSSSDDIVDLTVHDKVLKVEQIETPRKKPKLDKSIGLDRTKGGRGKKNAVLDKKKTINKKKGAEPGEKKERKRKTPTKAKIDLTLKPRPHIKVLLKDPLFETSTKMPFISKFANSRLTFRAVNLGDLKLLKSFFNDKDKTKPASVILSQARTVDNVVDEYSAIHYAIKDQKKEILKYLITKEEDDYVKSEYRNFCSLNTGSYNPRSLGIEAVRPLTVSRGVKEGNEALMKDTETKIQIEKDESCFESYLECAMKHGVSKEILEIILEENKKINYADSIYDTENVRGASKNIDLALQNGHRQTIVDALEKSLQNDYRRDKLLLYLKVLVAESADELKGKVPPSAVAYKAKMFQQMSPIHFAVINPKTEIMEKLLSVNPDFQVADKKNRRPIHFAAGCEDSGPLENLMKKGANIYDADVLGQIPLHYAVKANRLKNVEVLLKAANEEGKTGGDILSDRYGKGNINRPTKASWQPLHLAAATGNTEIIKILIENGAVIDSMLSINKMKLTPLMIACQQGHLEAVECLIKLGADPEKTDRLLRTPLIHAGMNGNANVMSYLINIGVNVDRSDSSNNTPLHYTTAYGWYFCTQLLLQAGCQTNISNDWKTTALSMTYMKGHLGIFHQILEHGTVDIDFPDDQGQTLVFLAAKYPNSEDLLDQVNYLMTLKPSLNIVDIFKKTPLYHLAEKDITPPSTKDEKISKTKKYEESMTISVQIAKLFVSHGCDHQAQQENGWNALNAALAMGNVKLALYLKDLGCPIETSTDDKGNNVLHCLIQKLHVKHFDMVTPVLNFLTNSAELKDKDGVSVKEKLKILAGQKNDNGLTPLLSACDIYLSSQTEINHLLKQDDTLKHWFNIRKLFKFFLTVCEVDVDVTPSKVKLNSNATSNTDEKFLYANCRGGWTAMDHIVSIKTETHEKDISYVVQMLLDYDQDLNCRSLDGTTPLMKACAARNLQVAKLLLKSEKCDPNIPKLVKDNDKIYNVPILFDLCTLSHHRYVESDDVKERIEIIQLLVKNGVDVNAKNEKEETYLVHKLLSNEKSATAAEFTTKVLELIRKPLNTHLTNKKDQTAMHVAFNQCEGSLDEDLETEFMLMTMCSHGLCMKDHIGRTPLHYLFVKEDNHEDSSNIDPIELCRKYFTYDGRPIFEKDKFGKTPLHYAAYRGAKMCCNFFVQRDAHINAKDNIGNTPLAYAVLGGHDSCATLLVQSKADVDIEVTEPNGKEEEQSACWKWEPDRTAPKDVKSRKLFEVALEQELNGVMFMLMDLPIKQAVLEIYAIEMGLNCKKYSFVMRLLSTMNDPKCVTEKLGTNHDRNLLHLVALVDDKSDQEWQMYVVQKLINRNVSLTAKDEFKCTPLFYCLLRQKYRLADYLIKTLPSIVNGKLVDMFGRTLLAAFLWNYQHMRKELKEILKLLIVKVDLNKLYDLPVVVENFNYNLTNQYDYWTSPTDVKISALIFAIVKGDFELAQMLLNEGKADSNICDSQDRTPLMYAIMKNDVRFVKLLLNHSWTPDGEDTKKTKKTSGSKGFGIKPRNDDDDDDDEDNDDEDDEEEDEEDMEEDEKPVPVKKAKGYEVVQNTSGVVINNWFDENQNTPLHYFVQSLHSSTASFANEEILFALVKAGADHFQTKNNDGLTAQDLAFKNNAVRACDLLNKYNPVYQSFVRLPGYKETEEIDDGVVFKGSCDPSLFLQDAEKMVKKLDPYADDEEDDDEEMNDNIIQPDISEYCNISDGKLVLDKDQDLLYTTLLTKVDINSGSYGIYNFYQIQLLYQPGKDLYILFTRWGRIGDRGQYQTTPFQTEADGVKNFCSIFKSKTGNAWTNIKSFEEHPNKYHLVDASWSKKPEKKTAVDIRLDYTIACQLPSNIQSFVKQIVESKARKIGSYWTQTPIDKDIFAFGKIDEAVLKAALKILHKIGQVLKQEEEYRSDNTELDHTKLKIFYNELSELNSEYFRKTPRAQFAFDKMTPITRTSELNRELSMIRNLLNMERATKILLGAMYNHKDVNPMDYVYKTLGCKMRLLDEDYYMSQYILCCMIFDDKCHSVKVQGIYEISRDGEEERLKSNDKGNRMLLWHGTNEANFIGILHRGLLYNPADNHSQHGQLYGEGIYFADQFHKSRRYSSSSSDVKLILLAEVALGNQLKLKDMNELKGAYKMYDSLFVPGRNHPDPRGKIILPTGVTMCVGDGVYETIDEDGESIFAGDNEYIVFNEDQICLRYVVAYTN